MSRVTRASEREMASFDEMSGENYGLWKPSVVPKQVEHDIPQPPEQLLLQF